MKQVILASTSPARRALLAQAGIAHEVLAPGVEEHLDPGRSPADQARELAAAKARAVAALRSDAIVIGADQVLDLGGRALGKPEDAQAAAEQLAALAGRRHALVTAFCVCADGRAIEDAEVTHLTVRPLSARQIDFYVASGEWRGCAGGYRLEGLGIALFERIEGDPTNVLGLPLPRLLGHLAALGVPVLGDGSW